MGTLVEMRFATLLALQLCVLFVLIHTVQATEKRYTPIRGDLKYIRCEVCERLSNVLHTQASAAKAEAESKHRRFTETDVATVIDEVCSAEIWKGGDWILKFDVVKEEETLKLKRHGEEGACRRECKTIADSCQDQLDSLDDIDELQVALWKGTSKKALRKNLCSEWSSACTPGKKNMPYAGIRKDEEFTPSGQAQEEELKALKKEQTRKANAEEAAAKRRKQKKPNAEASAADVFDAGAAVTAVAGALTSWMDDVTGGLREIYDEKFKKYMSYKESKKFLMTSFTDMYKELYTKMTMKRVKRYAKFMMKAHSPTKSQKDKKSA